MVEGLGGSKVDVRLKYNYTHAPYYLQDQLQSQNKQVAGVDFNFISNFSSNVEIVLNSNSSMHWSESGLRKNRYFEEMAELTLRTDIIPKIRFTSVVNYSYKHSYDIQNEEPTTIFLRASLSRELGEKGEISLDGYNLLNVKNSNSLSLKPEYLIYRSRYSPGRYFLLTYALKIK